VEGEEVKIEKIAPILERNKKKENLSFYSLNLIFSLARGSPDARDQYCTAFIALHYT